MALPAVAGFIFNAISNALVGFPVVITRLSVAMWALKSADELAPGVLELPQDDPTRQEAERKIVEDFLRETLPLTWPPAISPTLGTTPDPKVKVKVVRYVDPLILDLDGDGLEISPLSKSVLFDANGDTIKTGTAWAASDDGMLVWDRNGNGLIDSGAELFGDETILSTGPNAGKKAANGFVALAELDSNADGKFDLSDAQYANLRIWRDMNQDGISQADELQILADSGVKSIGLTNTTVNTNYTDAILAQSGNFTRMDDSTGRDYHDVKLDSSARAASGVVQAAFNYGY